MQPRRLLNPETPLVSVIVPAHNAVASLRECLTSLQGSDSDGFSWELVVVDDSSTDATRSLAREFTDRVAWTDAISGPAEARNQGAAMARGEILVFVDSDCAVNPDVLRRFVDNFNRDPSLIAQFGSYDDAPKDQGIVSRYRNLLHHYAHHQSAGYVSTFWAGCGAVRTEAFRSVNGFDARKYARPQIEDIELGYRLGKLGPILLDPSIQCTHYKRWTLWSMLRTDLRDRAIPWMRLLLAREPQPGSATPSLGKRALASTAAAGAAAAAFVFAIVGGGLPALGAAAVLLLAVILLNLPFYTFLKRRGGLTLAVPAVPLHLLYQLESAIAIPVGILLYLVRDKLGARSGTAPRSAGAIAGARFVPLAFGEVGARLLAFVATAYLARMLGASGFGQIGFALAVVANFGAALAMGIGEVGARDVARDSANATRIAATGLALRVMLGVVAIIAIFAITSMLNIDSGTRTVTWLYSLSIIPLALDTGWVYKGLGRTSKVARAMLVGQGAFLLLIMAFVGSSAHVTRVPVVQIIGDLTAAAVLLIPLMRGKWHKPAWAAIRQLGMRTRMITFSRMLRTVVVSADVIILGLMVSAQEVGWYSAAYRIVFFVMAIIQASHVAFLPEVARAADSPRQMSLILSRSIGLALTAAAPLVVGGIIIAIPMIDLVFGIEYRNGAVPLQLLLFGLLLFAVHGATRNVFLAAHRIGLEAAIIAVGVVVNIGLNVILIPRYGISGAAVATVAGEVTILAGGVIALARMQIRPGARESIPALLACSVMAAGLIMFSPGRQAWQSIMVGGALYTLSLGAATLVFRRTAAAVPEAR